MKDQILSPYILDIDIVHVCFKYGSHIYILYIDVVSSEVSNVKRTKKHFKNEQRSKDAAAKKRANTSGVGKSNNYYEDIYIPPYNNIH